ncbi:hypothetical protein GF325_11160 [Candidatus Bathyarchaeota archaeon]|nr:hypothetical protein [Candidatus Bathyarchaeota archaeon]
MDEAFGSLPMVRWQDWLHIDSRELYLDAICDNLGIDDPGILGDKHHEQDQGEGKMAVDPMQYISNCDVGDPIVLCHTSGTSTGSLSGIKWYPREISDVKQSWSPGMQAIFGSSGMAVSSGTPVILVPSRLKIDGTKIVERKTITMLYSAEFSQRLVISLFNPKEFLLDQYKNAFSPKLLSSLCSLEQISVVSAPSATMIGWSKQGRIKRALKKAIEKNMGILDDETSAFMDWVRKIGPEEASREIRQKIACKMRHATLIFSTTGFSPEKWNIIHEFMGWETGAENFTNLYVSSETGPFCASIDKEKILTNDPNHMVVFPLIHPSIRTVDGSIHPFHHLPPGPTCGVLIITVPSKGRMLHDIDTGDWVNVIACDPLPILDGNIMRQEFPLKQDASKFLPDKLILHMAPRTRAFVGGHLVVNDDIEINGARNLARCMKREVKAHTPLIFKVGESDDHHVDIHVILEGNPSSQKVKDAFIRCGKIKDDAMTEQLQVFKVHPDSMAGKDGRKEILAMVRAGDLPKGALTKWPVIVLK